jgi:hypothetical protein
MMQLVVVKIKWKTRNESVGARGIASIKEARLVKYEREEEREREERERKEMAMITPQEEDIYKKNPSKTRTGSTYILLCPNTWFTHSENKIATGK